MPSSSLHPILIQVLPRLTPGRCGVSDQAVLLARALKEEFAIDSAFVTLNSREPNALHYPTIHCLPSQLLENCVELAEGRDAALFVHVSGYGYSADGAPALLADALETVRANGRVRIATYFHEISASGPPWTSAFWHAHRQKKAARRIIAQCSLIVTSIDRQAAWLRRESRRLGGARVEQMPVFSPADETDEPVPFNQRNPIMVMFGLAATRTWAYKKLSAAENLVSTLGIQEILDVGPECDNPSEVNGVRVKRVGSLPAEDLPAVFSQSQFGFVPHPWFCLGKSSVFAAYCAQGMIPVVAGNFPKEVDGLREGIHVVTPQTAEAVRRSEWEACSRAAWTWYMGHRLHVHAERYAKWMRNGH